MFASSSSLITAIITRNPAREPAPVQPAETNTAPTEYDLFVEQVKIHCGRIDANHLELSENELTQLQWYQTSPIASPQVGSDEVFDPLHFEVKRGLARRASFELLMIGDHDSYLKFIKDQPEPKLEKKEFKKLSAEAQALNPDIKTVVRLSCFLTVTAKAKELLLAHGHKPADDSEEFLTQLAGLLRDNKTIRSLCPIASQLTERQLWLVTKMYWPNTHLRHMQQTEGGDNMTVRLRLGIKSYEYSLVEFPAYKWRWLTTSFGFDPGSKEKYYTGAKYHNADINTLTSIVISELENCFGDSDYSYLDGYLQQRAKLAGFVDPKLTEHERYFLGHLAAFCNQVHIMGPDTGATIEAAYLNYKESLHETAATQLADDYHAVRKDPLAITPTYVTSVYTTAYKLIHEEELRYERNPVRARNTALLDSTRFMCHILANLYKLTLAMAEPQRISMQALAGTKNLSELITSWREIDRRGFKLSLNDKFEVSAEVPRLLIHRIC